MSTEAPRCSEFARSIGVLPPGTGLFLNRVILVSVPLPWPKPALNHPELRAAGIATNSSAVASRLFAAEPFGDDVSATVPVVEVYERSAHTSMLHRWTLANNDVIEPLVTSIAATGVGDLARVDVAGATRTVTDEPPAPTFLICTQGSHDMCCGTSGVAFANDVEKSYPDYVVRRVSHTGGHRFSPTLLAFPEGRMWAYVDMALVERIATDCATADDHRLHARGWWGAKPGPAQVAECAVRAARPNQPFVAPVIEPGPTSDARPGTSYVVSVGDDSWLVDVTVAREVPSIACEAPGGRPAKPGREFAWSIEQQ